MCFPATALPPPHCPHLLPTFSRAGPVHPTYPLSRTMADLWMLFPTEEEYIRVCGVGVTAGVVLTGRRGRGDTRCCSGEMRAFLTCS